MKTLAMFFLLLLDSQHSSGVPVKVYEGAESVLLPCQVPADVSRRSTAVVWNRDEFTLPKVHMHKPNGDDLTNQNDRYLSRTRMRGDALQTGDLSLTLKNPTVSDSGHYTCTTRKAGEDLKKIYIQLKVSEPPPPVWPKVLAAVLVPVVLLTVLYGVFMHCEHKKLKHKAVCMLKPEKVTEGAESVKLPWRTIVDLSAAVRVTWTRVQPTHREICECVKDQTGRWKLQAVDGYKDRVQMDPDSVTNGDFSLTLKYPRCEDGGFYLCVILDEDENPITLTIVAIWVKETWETAITGLFMCGRKETDTERRLTDEVSRILENSYGRQRIFQMVENLDGKENAEAARLLNA